MRRHAAIRQAVETGFDQLSPLRIAHPTLRLVDAAEVLLQFGHCRESSRAAGADTDALDGGKCDLRAAVGEHWRAHAATQRTRCRANADGPPIEVPIQ